MPQGLSPLSLPKEDPGPPDAGSGPWCFGHLCLEPAFQVTSPLSFEQTLRTLPEGWPGSESPAQEGQDSWSRVEGRWASTR